MRINYKTYPILEKAKKGVLGTIPIDKKDLPSWDSVGFIFKESFSVYSQYCKKNILLISESYHDASMKSRDKISTLIKQDNELNMSATYIVKDYVFFIHQTPVLKKDFEIFLFAFHKSGQPVFCFIKNELTVKPLYWSSSLTGWEESDVFKKIKQYFTSFLIYDFFKKYAEVETKILEPKKKVKMFGCKYLNETDMNITHLDSKWFTNLVKSDAFKVRGHFRLQPKKKEGKWIKELIWINDFEKSGYTAPARKLTQTQ